MISVLNHLLPLNGSRLVVYMLVPAFIALFSCRTTKPIADEVVVVPVVVQDEKDEPVENEDTVIIPIDIEEPEIEPEAEVHKGAYKIALLLPFSLDKYDPAYQDAANTNIGRSTRMALEFYQGFQFAVDGMEQDAIDAEVFVFDTRNDPSETRRILNGPDFPDADLLIGPIYNKNLRVAAEFCKKNKIPMISPLSSSASITDNNPYYYSANGTSQSHYEALVHHIRKFYPEDTVHIIHNGSQREREVIDMFMDISTAEYEEEANPVIEIEMTTESNTFDLKHEFDSLSNHVVFIPSYDEIFTNYALNQLAQIKTYYPSVVFGMPTWINFSKANYDYFEWLQVHLTESSWINDFNINVANMQRDFAFRYDMDPSEYAFQGYDLAHFVITFLSHESGIKRNKERFFTVDRTYDGLHTNYRFTPRINIETDKVDYWDNEYIHILKFENYRYNKVD